VPVRLRVPKLLMSIAGLSAIATSAAFAQSTPDARAIRRELVGVVRDPNGAALEGVSVGAQGLTTRTDARGAFRLFTNGSDTLTIMLRLVGFDPIDALLTARASQWDTVLVQMERGAQRLASVDVKEAPTRKALGLRTFEERRARRSGGVFISREDILEHHATRLSDVLRTRRGVQIVSGRVRFVSSMGGNRNACVPDVWLDGQRVKGMEVNDILASDVEAMELYPNFSTVPFEFTATGPQSTPCGTIVIWTRIPNGKGK
jgi:hypothetical protein